MKRFPMIDAAKLYCALLIVLLHSLAVFEGHYFGHMAVASLCYQAVPFFLIVSGFFFTRNLEKAADKRHFLFSYVKKLLIYYVLWILILSPETISLYLEKYPDRSWLYIAAVVARRVIFSGNGVYWYLLVLAESAVILSFFLSRGWEKALYILGGIGLFLGLAYDAQFTSLGLGHIRRIMYTIFAWSNNFLMKGVPYMAIGCFLARNYDRWSFRAKHLAVVYASLVLINIVLFVTLYPHFSHPEWYMWLYPLQAVVLLLFCIAADGRLIPEHLAREARSMSSAIYCVHCFFLNYAVTPMLTEDASTALRFLLAAAMSIALYLIVKRLNWKPLRRLLTLS